MLRKLLPILALYLFYAAQAYGVILIQTPPSTGITMSGNPETAYVDSSTALVVSAISSGCSEGDVLFAITGQQDDATTVSDDSEFTLITDSNCSSGAGGDRAIKMWYRVVTASEPADYSWTFGNSNGGEVVLECFQGVDTASPVDQATCSTAENCGSTLVVSPSVTPSGAGYTVLFGVLSRSDSATQPAWTVPTGTPTVTLIDEEWESVSASWGHVGLGYMVQPTATATDTRVWPAGATGDAECAMNTVSLNPE